MNNYYQCALISTIAFISAFLFYAIYNEWIIVCPSWHNNMMHVSTEVMQKKQVVLHYFHGDKWKMEKQEMLWHDNNEKNIFHLVNAWLTLLDEEHITTKKTTLQSALVTLSGTIYLSFDRAIFNKEETIFKKWMLVEGLLKTIALHNNGATHVQFLVQHQQLVDAHLDFSLSWPVHGFIT